MMTTFNRIIPLVFCLVGFQSAANYTLPDYQEFTLDNGLTVMLMEQNEVPLIDVNIVIKAGAIADNEKAGLAQITADNLVFGTSSKTKSEVNDEVDFIGANLNSSANLEFSKVTASFAKKDQDQILSLLQAMVLDPRFETKDFENQKKRHLLKLEQAKESPKSVINNYFARFTFGEGGYGAAKNGNATSVAAISLDDVKSFHQSYYQPKNSAIVVVGDFDTKKMKKQISKLFGKWKNEKSLPKTAINSMPSFEKSRVLLVDKKDAVETTFLIGGKGIKQSNEDRVGISVINTILGGRFTSWLNDELRVNAGLTYGARSRFNTYGQSGSFVISTFTKTETTIDAVDLALKTYEKLWTKGVNEETLASAKAYVKGQFPPKFETSAQLAALLATMYGYDIDNGYINNFEEQVNSLNINKTKELINKYFPKDNLQFVMIGKADDIKNKVVKYGEVSQVNISDVGFQAK